MILRQVLYLYINLNFLSLKFEQPLSSSYFKQHNYDKLWQSETFLNTSVQSDEGRIRPYKLLKKSGTCIYYKELVFLIKRDDNCILDNYFITKICPQNKNSF